MMNSKMKDRMGRAMPMRGDMSDKNGPCDGHEKKAARSSPKPKAVAPIARLQTA